MTSPFSPWVRSYWKRHVLVVELGGAACLWLGIIMLGQLGLWPS